MNRRDLSYNESPMKQVGKFLICDSKPLRVKRSTNIQMPSIKIIRRDEYKSFKIRAPPDTLLQPKWGSGAAGCKKPKVYYNEAAAARAGKFGVAVKYEAY